MTKRKNKILLIIAIVLFIVILILRNFLIEQALKNKQYNSLDDFETPKEVIQYIGGKYIKEKKSTDENFSLDIYATLAKNLYDGENSNKDYYYELIQTMGYTLKFDNFRIIDDEKKLLISVLCDKSKPIITNIYINGESNYFESQDSKYELEKFDETPITDFNIQAPELQSLIDKNWNKNTIDLTNAKSIDENYVSLDDIHIRTVHRNVFNIVFNYKYSGNVLNNINVQNSLDEVIEILGEPTFGSKDSRIIGYKGKNIYVFFSYSQISVYRVEDYDTTELIDILKQYNEDKDLKKYVSAITDMWQDYNLYKYDTNYINLQYALKGLKIQYNINSENGLIIYSNYVGDTSDLVELKEEYGLKEIYFKNENSVYEEEIRRLNDAKG